MADVLILDNGAGILKAGMASDDTARLVPNAVTKAKNVRTRIFIGDQIDECKDLSGLFYILPFQKGYLVNWDAQRQVWDHVFGKDVFNIDCADTTVIVTEPLFNFTSVQEGLHETIFEDYGFKAAFCTNASYLSHHKHIKDHGGKASYLSHHKHIKDHGGKGLCCLVVDSGYSFTHIVPYFKGKKMTEFTRRITVGGKLLTNHLKEVISYRQLMVMDETHVMNQMKEDVCYVSTQFNKDMETTRKKGPDNDIARDYVLPDYTHIKRGHVRPMDETTGRAQGNEQIMRMNNERFSIPEVLFHPSDIGVHEMGISEAIHVIESTPEEMRPHFYNNIVLTGGNCLLPGFQERIQQDVRCMADADYDVTVSMPSNPMTYAWQGGASLAKHSTFKDLIVTKADYDECGQNICFDNFDV